MQAPARDGESANKEENRGHTGSDRNIGSSEKVDSRTYAHHHDDGSHTHLRRRCKEDSRARGLPVIPDGGLHMA